MENQKYNFQKFTGHNARLGTKISVTKSFSLGFPAKFVKDHSIQKYKYVVLFFDKEIKAVGVQFTNDDNEASKYSIIRGKRGYGCSTVIRSFFNTYNIDPKKYSGKYEWKLVDFNDKTLYVFELKEKHALQGNS